MTTLIFRDYDHAGDAELFRSNANQFFVPNIGDTVILKYEESFVVLDRSVVYERLADEVVCSAIVCFVTSKGVSQYGLRSVQERSTSGPT